MKYHRLTTPQQNIWNLQKYYSDTAVSNLCGAIFYKEKRDREKLCQAICQFIESQTGMRLRFYDKGVPMQYVSGEIDENIPFRSFASMDEFDRYAQDFAGKPIELTDGAMYRFVQVQVGNKSGILFALSHLIADAWTCALMADGVEQAYHKLMREENAILPQADYTKIIEDEDKYLVSERYQKDKAYWEGKYSSYSGETALFEKSLIKTHLAYAADIRADRITKTLPVTLECKMTAFCEKTAVTQAVLFETALIIYLSKINSENKRITIGVPVLNRNGIKERDTVGMFISTMPLTVEVEKDMAAADLAKQVAREHISIFRHQRYPYADILQMVREKQSASSEFSGNLYDVMVSYQNAETGIEADTKWYSNGYSEIPLAIHIDNRDENDSHTINVDYQISVFSNAEANYLIDRLEYILEQITENEAVKLKDVRILPAVECKKLTEDFNNTAVDYPREKCVHELFEEQAGKTPDKVALVFHGESFTYSRLDGMANALAHALTERGIGRGDTVPIIAKRSFHIVAAMLGILKSGAAYMPVSPSYPKERIIRMMGTAESRVALCYGYSEKLGAGVEQVEMESFDYKKDFLSPETESLPEDLCYVIFTSGSTGEPKGVSISHRNVVNYCNNNNNNNNVCSRIIKNGYRSIVSVTNFVFDIFVTETILPLLNGRTVYFADEEESMRQDRLASLVEQNRIEVIQTTPTKMRSFLLDKEKTGYLGNFKAVILGGEAFPADLYTELRKYTDACIFNIYGPAETTVWSSNAEVVNEDITIGKPIANTQIYILDSDRKPVPIGVAGELCIAGDGVGLGYLNRPELTAERFVPNPFATKENGHGETMYRTGDLARWRVDGEIEYLGRIDTQVKIRGLRIELGEIESVMAGFPGIALCAVADKMDGNGRQYLAGYYTSAGSLDEKGLRAHLSAKLPSYMVPNYFMKLDEMPMTPSGKTDRKNLPEPDLKLREDDYVAPETDTEIKLAEVWKKLLKLPQVGRDDNFFELGGDSLLVLALHGELETSFSAKLSVKDLLASPGLRQMAQLLEQSEEYEDILKPQYQDKYILLPQQKAIYAACLKEPDSLLYNMPAKFLLPESLDRKKLEESIRQVMQRHRILKSRIVSENGELYGIYEENAGFRVEKYADEKEFIRPFKLDKVPLFRVGFTENALLFDIHHIIADGTTVSILLRDIAAVYEGNRLPKQNLWYGDYAEYFHRCDFREHRDFYREALSCEFEKAELPTAKTGKNGGKSRFYRIPAETMAGAKKFARENTLTDTMVFLGVYGILLSKYTGKKDVLGSIILQNRIHAEQSDLAGMFVNTLPVYFRAEGDTPAYFAGIKEMLLSLFQYQELPFWEIAEAVGIQDKDVINTSFVYQAEGRKKIFLDGQSLTPEYMDTHTSKFELSIEITPLETEGEMRLEYDRGKYDSALVDELAEAYIRILGQLSEERLADISVLSDEMYRQVTEDFNDTAVDYPREKCVHELFEEQAGKTPDKVALVFRNRKYTYRQLTMLSDSLARYLQNKGVRQGDRVAVLLNRDARVIMAQLAVLKLGAVFIPIDSRYPKERIEYILSESGARVLLKNKNNAMSFNQECYIEDWNLQPVSQALCVHVSPDAACYVIFTSGSTGKPKGCMLTSKGIVNFCMNNNILETCNRLEEQNCVSVNTISFDFFIAESLLPLLNGYTVILANEEESMNQELFTRLVLENSVNIIQTTPTRFKLYFSKKRDLSYTRQFKVIVSSGESLQLDLLKSLIENTKAKVFNPLGPSECSVWVVGGELHQKGVSISNEDITIGKPIANTQIYILDSDRKPVPIGVAGELCIAGDGVGLGYLNRPELTAERFVPNPFATEENGHGETMYRTGDLARWRADGEIEYLGRIDTQVKIRGLRIELGEIESVMAGFPGIALCAVADKTDGNGRQYLAGYYTSEGSLDEKGLRAHLSAKLPSYMVPNYFMKLDEMPMTPSGKTDRKNLPEPDMKLREDDYVAPETDTEKILCRIAAELLDAAQVGVEDDFFLIGGDSLLAVSYVAKAHDAGIEFSIQNAFDYPTVRSLCNFLEKGKSFKVSYQLSDFEKYGKLFGANTIDNRFIPKKRALGDILLTGATGFLGAHILDCLMREETGRIYCLVRSNREDDRRGRLKEVLEYYFGSRYSGEIGNRIIPVTGDIEDENLCQILLEKLTAPVQTVIHTAASVKHFGSYEYFHKVNCEGTRHVMEYAKAAGARLVHISTLSVSGNSMAEDFNVYRSEEEKQFNETNFYIGQPLDNVYIHSKFEAERVVYDAVLSGLDAQVVRVGNLTNRLSDFKFQPNYRENAFLKRAKALLEFGMLPDYLMPLYAEFSPVDKTAEGIVKIAEYAGQQRVFHVYNSRHLYYDRFLEIAHGLGIPLQVVSGEKFYEALLQSFKQKGKEYIYEAFQNDLDEQGMLVYDSNIRIKSEFTLWFLERVGFTWNDTDFDYISGYIEYFRKLGFLEV